MKILLVFLVAISLGACSTFTTPRYSISADANVALKSLNAKNIGVGSFTGPVSFDNACRAVGPLSPPDGISFTEYLRKALEDELKVAGAYSANNPSVVLTGLVSRLEFSSSRGLTGGSWDIDLVLNSSNGKSLSAAEHYEFESGFIADTACKQTAEAYMPTVQNLLKKIVLLPNFKSLLSLPYSAADSPKIFRDSSTGGSISLDSKLGELKRLFQANLISKDAYEARQKALLESH